SSTRRRARLASWRAASGVRSTIGAISAKGIPKTSCRTNASRLADRRSDRNVHLDSAFLSRFAHSCNQSDGNSRFRKIPESPSRQTSEYGAFLKISCDPCKPGGMIRIVGHILYGHDFGMATGIGVNDAITIDVQIDS